MDEEIKDVEEVQDSETPVKKNSSMTVAAIIVVMVVAAIFIFMNKNKNNASQDQSQTVAGTETVAPTQTPELTPTKEFTVDGSNFAFKPKTLTVAKGDVVKINFKDDDGFHNLVIDGYNVKTETIKTGNMSSVTFVADKVGTFEYYCSVPTHKDKGMTGTLTVK